MRLMECMILFSVMLNELESVGLVHVKHLRFYKCEMSLNKSRDIRCYMIQQCKVFPMASLVMCLVLLMGCYLMERNH